MYEHARDKKAGNNDHYQRGKRHISQESDNSHGSIVSDKKLVVGSGRKTFYCLLFILPYNIIVTIVMRTII